MSKTPESGLHTGEPDCPECARIEAESSAQEAETKELVDALMKQWDEVIDRMAVGLGKYLKRKGRETVVNGARRFADYQKKTES